LSLIWSECAFENLAYIAISLSRTEYSQRFCLASKLGKQKCSSIITSDVIWKGGSIYYEWLSRKKEGAKRATWATKW